jgi:predicted RNase H-like HicB family nuclease
MDENKVAVIAEKIATNDAIDSDQALANCDEAVDNIIAALTVLDENLPNVKPENVPQQAALDNIKEALDQAVKPYFADVVKDFTFFDD